MLFSLQSKYNTQRSFIGRSIGTNMDQNEDSGFRIHLAGNYGKSIDNYPGLQSIFVTGSSSRGHADAYSDLEIGVIWEHFPSEDQRESLLKEAGGIDHRLFPEEDNLLIDEFYFGRADPEIFASGMLIEVVHMTKKHVEETIKAVIHQSDVTLESQKLMSAFFYGIPLAGQDFFKQYQNQVKIYPDELQKAMIDNYSTISHFWRIKMIASRNRDRAMYYHYLLEAYKRFLLLLLGLNKVYFPGFKWVDYIKSQMGIAPKDFEARSLKIFSVEPEMALSEFHSLIIESYELLKQKGFLLDYDRLLAILNYQRFAVSDEILKL